MAWNALGGVRIWDASALLPGPFTTQIFADLGADVVKMEAPGGDPSRDMLMAIFPMANRNKRSIAVDLKSSGADAVVTALADWADVFVEGFRPGVTERLGIGYEALSKINPRIIYCSLSGYGQTGPSREVPGHDLNYLAASGAMALRGRWLDESPNRSGLPVADLAGASFAAISILAALRDRDRTGKGCYIDVSLTDASIAFTAIRQGLDIDEPEREHLFPTNDLFTAADGRKIALGMVEEHFWQNFRRLLAEEEPKLMDPRFHTEPGRREHGDEVARLIASVITRRSSAEWVALLSQHDIPAQLALTPREAAQSEQVRHRGIVRLLDGVSHVPFPVLVNGEPAGALLFSAPTIGANTSAILRERGFKDAEIERLYDAGVLTGHIANKA